MKELNRFRQFLTEGHINENLDPKTTDFLNRTIDGFLSGDYSDPLKVGEDKTYTFNAIENEAELKVGPDFAKIGDKFVTFEDGEFSTFSAKKLDGDEYAIKVLAKKELNENEDDGYDRASKELFDMTWDEVRRENDPRMRQAVHDEVQKDDDTYIDDVQENQSSSQEFYEVEFVEMDGNEVTRDFRHFTDENEAKQMFNDLKGNPEIVKVTRNELFKGDGKNYLGGSEERERFVNSEPEMHRMFLNSRLGDKRFIAEPVTDYFGRRNRARKRFLQFEPVSEMKPGDEQDIAQKRFDRLSKDDQTKLLQIAKMVFKEKANTKDIEEQNLSLEEIYKDIMEVDEEEEKIRKELDGMKRPSQDEVNDAFEKFEREAHYLNNKPVGEWDAADMSNWKSILRKGGKIMESMNLESIYEDQGFLTDARYKLYYTTKDGKENSIGFISGLNAEDEFYRLMDDKNIVSAKIDYVYTKSGKPELSMEFTRDENGEADVKFG